MIGNLDIAFQILCMIMVIVDGVSVLYYDAKNDQYRVLKYLMLTLLMVATLRMFQIRS